MIHWVIYKSLAAALTEAFPSATFEGIGLKGKRGSFELHVSINGGGKAEVRSNMI
jgi:hypothetical protein